MNPGGNTQPYAVLGHPIAHTLSPAMHNAAFSALGMDAIYLAFDALPDKLPALLAALRELGFRGVNLTSPLKEVAFSELANLDESARLVGAVNTVLYNCEGVRGFNTDGDGFLRAFEEAFRCSVEDQDVIVLGSGGSARTLALVCAREGASSVTIVARNQRQSCALIQQLRSSFASVHSKAVCEPAQQLEAIRAGGIVIQATTVGTRIGDPPLFPPSAFRPGQLVYDLVYAFPETSTLRAAREAGACTVNGLDMLLYQGARAFEIWTNTPPPVNVMRDALRKALL